MIEKLASIHCTNEEIASCVGCHPDTLADRFSELLKKARDTGKASLRRLQWEGAQKGQAVMLIWLGKQLLGQKDVSRIEVEEIPDAIFEQEAQRRLKLVTGT